MLNIVVVFPKKEIVLKMKNVLIKNGFDVSAVCVTGAQAIQAVERLEAGVVVCGIRFADMIYNELKECIPDTFEMVVIASNAQWQEYGDDDVIYLPLPLKAYDLVDTVLMTARKDVRGWGARKGRWNELKGECMTF